MKNKNILKILEAHVDKIVLTVYVLVGLFLLWTYVIFPKGETITVRGRQRKVGPSQIDRYVKQELDSILPKMLRPPEQTPPVPSYYDDFDQKMLCSISEISSSTQIPMSSEGDGIIPEDRLYTLPQIPSLSNVHIAAMRGAGQIPTEEVGPDKPYKSALHEIRDIDLVTVSARFNVPELFSNFQQSFMGPRLKTSWKDDTLASPVFARMELQRRSKQQDGSWDSWQVVSRTKIDAYGDLIEDLPINLEKSQYGVDVWMSQFMAGQVQNDILQPVPYNFTISRLEWMAPDFLDEARTILDKEEQQEKREKIEKKKQQQGQQGQQRRRTNQPDNRRMTQRRPAKRQPQQRNRDDMMTQYNMGVDPTGVARRKPQKKERTLNDVSKDYKDELLDEKTKIASLQDPLLVWVHDDSLEPGNTYQYRIRIGVFNPIAGKDWFVEEQSEYKDQLVLWSDFSEQTKEIEIPDRIYMFPLDVIADKDSPTGTERIKVEVAKYYLGRWRDYDFEVYPGQMIGYEVEDKEKKPLGQDMDMDIMGDYQEIMTGMNLNDNIVDFSTESLFVDVLNKVTWGDSLRRSSNVYTMLYSDSDNQIRHLPVGKQNWDSDVSKQYAMIQESIDRGVQRRTTKSTSTPRDRMPMEMMRMRMMRFPQGAPQ